MLKSLNNFNEFNDLMIYAYLRKPQSTLLLINLRIERCLLLQLKYR